MNFQKLLQSYVNSSYEDLVEGAKNDLCVLGKAFGGSENLAKIAVAVTLTCFGVDGAFTEKEHAFMCDVLSKIGYENAKNMVQGVYDNQKAAEEALDEFADGLSNELKTVLADYVCRVLAVDEELKVPEIKFIQKLIA